MHSADRSVLHIHASCLVRELANIGKDRHNPGSVHVLRVRPHSRSLPLVFYFDHVCMCMNKCATVYGGQRTTVGIGPCPSSWLRVGSLFFPIVCAQLGLPTCGALIFCLCLPRFHGKTGITDTPMCGVCISSWVFNTGPQGWEANTYTLSQLLSPFGFEFK